jgi:hypothetical protein
MGIEYGRLGGTMEETGSLSLQRLDPEQAKSMFLLFSPGQIDPGWGGATARGGGAKRGGSFRSISFLEKHPVMAKRSKIAPVMQMYRLKRLLFMIIPLLPVPSRTKTRP